jgi:hypothetical protein
MKFALDGAKNSKTYWESYMESEEDKNIYTKKSAIPSNSSSSLESLG